MLKEHWTETIVVKNRLFKVSAAAGGSAHMTAYEVILAFS